ncbi:MAG: heme ABC exporter ATP-binding protein CcmA [Planctomycetota bacterium]|nr:MAG: heme ABC exporter ATP-binding protein CcmA [Planctomycetota bacterium]
MPLMRHASECPVVEREFALEAQSLSVDYGHRRILRSLTIAIRPGEIVELRGGNGSGKTTLLRCLAGIVRPTLGRVTWFGEPAGCCTAMRKWLGVLAHESSLYSHLTLAENLLFVARVCGVERPRERVAEALHEIGLADRSQCTPPKVSRGTRQRVSIARAFLHGPRVVLLDEPFTGLDAAGRDWLVARLARARDEGQTVCLATHEQVGSLAVCDRVFTLHDGKFTANEATADHPPIGVANSKQRMPAA